jgi:glucokinase
MNGTNDERIVMTLDAGGTNFVFSALQKGKEIVGSVNYPSNAHDLDLCLKTLVKGFEDVKSQLSEDPVAISFAFPGPADYKSGIIGDLPNLPSFRGGVALGPMLQDIFNIPVFINNDGNLFTYGEAMAGLLPEVNGRLTTHGIHKQYKNLFGITLGTGFGGGIVIENKLYDGDNSAAGEIWLMRNYHDRKLMAEEGACIRAVQRSYAAQVGDPVLRSPKEIYEIAIGEKEGEKEAAVKAYHKMAAEVGEALSNAITLIDGLVVIGGGVSGAASLLMPKIVEHMNGIIENAQGDKYSRLVSKVYNLEDPESVEAFLDFKVKELKVPLSNRIVSYTPEKRIAVGLTRLGTSKAIALGAYAYALENLGS